jgi:hypothetical protein
MSGFVENVPRPDLVSRARQSLRRVVKPDPERYPIYLEFPIEPAPRFGWSRPPHAALERLISARSEHYARLLERIGGLDGLRTIQDEQPSEQPYAPHWRNPYFFGLDGAALYGMLALHRPARYVEVGSGYSTMFAAKAIADMKLPTTIISIDPAPRAAVAGLCDEIIRRPLEQIDLSIFSRLEPGDVLFVDGSHMSFMGSDVTITFLEVLPELPAGVLVHIHDVFLPWDYRPDWVDRYYSEQYLLAAMLLAEGPHIQIELPAFYVYNTPELARILEPLWTGLGLSGYETAGHSFWLRTA